MLNGNRLPRPSNRHFNRYSSLKRVVQIPTLDHWVPRLVGSLLQSTVYSQTFTNLIFSRFETLLGQISNFRTAIPTPLELAYICKEFLYARGSNIMAQLLKQKWDDILPQHLVYVQQTTSPWVVLRCLSLLIKSRIGTPQLE